MKRLLLLAPCILLTACVYSQSTNERQHGVNINPQQVALVEPGKTTKQWILTNLGIPDRTQADKEGFEVFEYLSEHTEKSSKTFIFLFDIDSDKVISRDLTRVVMRNGIVETINTSNLK